MKRNLVVEYKTYDQARAFAGEYGMNAILIEKSNNCMHLARLENDGEKFYVTFNENFHCGTYELSKDKYDIYWIGERLEMDGGK